MLTNAWGDGIAVVTKSMVCVWEGCEAEGLRDATECYKQFGLCAPMHDDDWWCPVCGAEREIEG